MRTISSGQLARFMGLKQGMTVADIGAGSGYHTVRLSRLLGPSGRVIAQDVTPNYLADLAKRADRLNLRNVRFALGEPHDPRLPPDSLDAAILVHMYHEIAQPYAFLYNLAPALKPGAPIGIVDLDKSITKHGTPPDLLRCDLQRLATRRQASTSSPVMPDISRFSRPRKRAIARHLKPSSLAGGCSRSVTETAIKFYQ